MIAPSQGAHLVLDRSFLPGDNAIMVPHTNDGRVMFAIPWHGHTLVGTTDTPFTEAPLEPVALDQEIEFMLETAGLYLEKKPSRADILSVFAGIRPLVKAGEGGNTAALSRDHTIHIDKSGLLSITGGKWTTYRNMAQGAVDHAATLAGLPDKPCLTGQLEHSWLSSQRGEFRLAFILWFGCAGDSAIGGRGRRVGPPTGCRTTLSRSRGGLGCAQRNGPDSRGCARASYTGIVSECQGSHSHGASGC